MTSLKMAQRRLPKGLFEFMHRGNDDEIAVRSFAEIKREHVIMPEMNGPVPA